MKNRLKVYRTEKNMTQEELALAMNVSRQTVIALERGKYDPSLPLAFKLANFFEITIEELFQYEGEE